jgi:hypothetical protein
MQLVIGPDGSGRCLYGEDIDLGKLGALTISRASHVEPDNSGRWFASMIEGQTGRAFRAICGREVDLRSFVS